MKTALLILALFLTGCGGVEAKDDPSYQLQTCETRAVRSNTTNTTMHSTDGGKAWLPGACG